MKKIKKIAIIGVSILVLFTSCSKQYDTVKSNKNDMKSSQISEKGFEYRINSNKLFDSDRVICEKLIDKYKDGYVFIGKGSYTESYFDLIFMSFYVTIPISKMLDADIYYLQNAVSPTVSGTYKSSEAYC